MPRPRLSADAYASGILDGQLALLSQAITLAESSRMDDLELTQQILQQLLPHTGRAIRIGITGSPGVGKSTFIEAFGLMLANQGLRVAVLAIDPTSERTGGSILGDKTRMNELSRHPNAFIRPSPSGGALGGVNRATRESILLCEAAGYQVVLVETVGVGQSETAVRDMTDFFLLLMLAGAGDELQGIKRGIMEMADAIVITKADGANLTPARRAQTEYTGALSLFPPTDSGWKPVVLTTSALENTGLDKVWSTIRQHRADTTANGWHPRNRQTQQRRWFRDTLETYLLRQFFGRPGVTQALHQQEDAVAHGHISPTQAALALLRQFAPTDAFPS